MVDVEFLVMEFGSCRVGREWMVNKSWESGTVYVLCKLMTCIYSRSLPNSIPVAIYPSTSSSHKPPSKLHHGGPNHWPYYYLRSAKKLLYLPTSSLPPSPPQSGATSRLPPYKLTSTQKAPLQWYHLPMQSNREDTAETIHLPGSYTVLVHMCGHDTTSCTGQRMVQVPLWG